MSADDFTLFDSLRRTQADFERELGRQPDRREQLSADRRRVMDARAAETTRLLREGVPAETLMRRAELLEAVHDPSLPAGVRQQAAAQMAESQGDREAGG